MVPWLVARQDKPFQELVETGAHWPSRIPTRLSGLRCCPYLLSLTLESRRRQCLQVAKSSLARRGKDDGRSTDVLWLSDGVGMGRIGRASFAFGFVWVKYF